jgi:hypothetical protein
MTLLAPVPDGTDEVDWEAATVSVNEPAAVPEAERNAAFAALPGSASRAKTYRGYADALVDWLRRSRPLVLWRAAGGERSRPGESEAEFRARLVHGGREQRDARVEALRQKYAPRLARADAAVRRAEEQVERQQSQYGGQKVQTAISVGATVLGALLGRRIGSGSIGRATTAARQASRTAREREDVARAEEELASAQQQRRALDAEFDVEVRALDTPVDPASIQLTEERITLRQGDVDVVRVALAWLPDATT